MQRTSGLPRLLATIVLILGTMVGTFLPVADAYAEQNAVTTEAHVEQPGSRQCPPAHDELACQVCRVLRLAAHGGPDPISLATYDLGARAIRVEAVGARPTFFTASTSSRAPPAR